MEHPVELFDKWLVNKQVKDQAKPYHGKWRAFMLGKCYRAQYWVRQHKAPSDAIPIEVMRIFEIGHVLHRAMQAPLVPEQCEQEFEFDDFVFHPDYFDDECVYDFKSIKVGFKTKKFATGFSKMKVEGFDIAKEYRYNVLQVMAEAYFMKKVKGELIYVCKDNGQTNIDIGRHFVFNTFDWEAEVLKEFAILRAWWGSEKLPPALPRIYNGAECKYCMYRSKCKEVEFNGGNNGV